MVVVETHSMKVRNWMAYFICLGMSWYIELQASPVMGCMHVCYPNPNFKFYHVAILDSISKVSVWIFAWKAFSSFWMPPSHHHKIFCTFCTFFVTLSQQSISLLLCDNFKVICTQNVCTCPNRASLRSHGNISRYRVAHFLDLKFS